MTYQPTAIVLDSILRASKVLCLIHEPSSSDWKVSPGLAELLGIDHDWVTWSTTRCLSLAHRDDRERWASTLDQLAAGKTTPPGIFRLKSQENAWYQVSCTTIISPAGPLLVINDVSAAMQIEAAFLDSQTRLNGLYNGTPVSIILWSKEGRIIGWNTKAEETFGYLRDAVIGEKLVSTLIAPSDYEPFSRSVSAALADNKGTDTICNTLTASGSIIQCRWRSVPMRNRKGTLTGLLSIAQDVTAELAAAASMQYARTEAERLNRAKSEFLAVVSHELRTPLNGILGMSQLLDSLELGDEIAPMVQEITDSGYKLLEIVSAMLNYAQADLASETQANQQFSLCETLTLGAQRHEFHARNKGLAFRLEIDPNIPDTLCGDETSLSATLAALCDNAIKFTEAGQISLCAQLLARTEHDATVHISLTDSGIGMTQEFMQHLYTPFKQAENAFIRKNGGVGLGLALCKKLVDRMHGKINLHSTPGQGTICTLEFTFHLAGEA